MIISQAGSSTAATLCRECGAIDKRPSVPLRCDACGSPRLVHHSELQALSIAHVDCDSFYASVEKRDRPEIADQPVIVGGGRRGVVSTCCYIARTFGVRSAMPMFKALKLCPEAIVIKPDMQKYVAASRHIRMLMDALTPVVEPLSLDEAFLDLTGTTKLHRATPAETLAIFAASVQREVGVTISVGLSHNKFLAKIASDLDKPRGFAVIGKEETLAFLAQQKVGLIWGVGKKLQTRLERDGITRIGQLQKMDEATLGHRYGSIGMRLFRLSRGQDSRNVQSRTRAKSVSNETTFNQDKSERSELLPILRRLSEKVSERLKAKDIAGTTVILKLKTREFKLRTRNRTLEDPTQLADRIFSVGADLLVKELDGTKFRLLGIGVSDLRDGAYADPEDLIDIGAQKRKAAELAMDEIRAKFGAGGVGLGLTFQSKGKSVSAKESKRDAD